MLTAEEIRLRQTDGFTEVMNAELIYSDWFSEFKSNMRKHADGTQNGKYLTLGVPQEYDLDIIMDTLRLMGFQVKLLHHRKETGENVINVTWWKE